MSGPRSPYSDVERSAIVADATLYCPVDRSPLPFLAREDGSADHRRVCVVCGAVVKLPRVPLARAIRRMTKGRAR